MQKINLRELYPDIYKTDTFLEVTDEVQAVFLADKRAEARYLRQMYNYKAHYSLDCDNGIEKAVVQHPPTPEEILEDQQLRDQLYSAVMELPDKQAKWIYARFYLGMTVKEIAQELNFPEQFTFRKYFKTHAGISPKEYKRQCGKKNLYEKNKTSIIDIL